MSTMQHDIASPLLNPLHIPALQLAPLVDAALAEWHHAVGTLHAGNAGSTDSRYMYP